MKVLKTRILKDSKSLQQAVDFITTSSSYPQFWIMILLGSDLNDSQTFIGSSKADVQARRDSEKFHKKSKLKIVCCFSHQPCPLSYSKNSCSNCTPLLLYCRKVYFHHISHYYMFHFLSHSQEQGLSDSMFSMKKYSEGQVDSFSKTLL